MERLLRDGGDLDSMDRSLLDYNGANTNGSGVTGGAGTVVSSSTGMSATGVCASSPGENGGIGMPRPPSTASATSPNGGVTSPTASHNGRCEVVVNSPQGNGNDCVKRDLVVRFTEQKNAVKSALADSVDCGNGGGNGGSPSAAVPTVTVTQQIPKSTSFEGNAVIDAGLTESTGKIEHAKFGRLEIWRSFYSHSKDVSYAQTCK